MTNTKPRVYTLCGSSRFSDAFAIVNMHLSLRGHIVIGLGMAGHADEPQGAAFLADGMQPSKRALDELHLRKIDISDGIFVINVGGYVGTSTRREIAYAMKAGKTVDWLFPDDIPGDILENMSSGVDLNATTYIAIKLSRATGDYHWDGERHPSEASADIDFSEDCVSYVGQLHGNKLQSVSVCAHFMDWRGTPPLVNERQRADIARQIGLELAR